MGCSCSKANNNAKVFYAAHQLSGPPLISLLNENDPTTLTQLSDGVADGLIIIRDPVEDRRGVIWLHLCRDLQMIPVGNMKSFVYVRDGIAQMVEANAGDLLFVMPFGTTPDIVVIIQGCHLSISKIRTLLETVRERMSVRKLARWQRRGRRGRFLPVSAAVLRWGPQFELGGECEVEPEYEVEP